MIQKDFVVTGAAKTAGVRRVSVQKGVVETQLEKSSVSLFKIIPSGVMSVEPQDKSIAVSGINVQCKFYDDVEGNSSLVISETTLSHLSVTAKWWVPWSSGGMYLEGLYCAIRSRLSKFVEHQSRREARRERGRSCRR